jgi:Legionella pneumophila major outer membrane protein precursor
MRFFKISAVALAIGSLGALARADGPSQLAFVSNPYLQADQGQPFAPPAEQTRPVVNLASAPGGEQSAEANASADLSANAYYDEPAAAPTGSLAMNSLDAPPQAPPSAPTAPSSQSTCSGTMCDCCPNWFFTAGAEATFMWTQAADSAGGFPHRGQLAASDFSTIQNQFDAAPRLWIGAENDCGWGLRGGFWRFTADDPTNNVTVGPPALFPVTDVTGDSNLTAWNVDLEVTRRVDRGCWQILATGGVRYADLQREESFTRYSTTDGIYASTDSTRNVDGTGLTGSLEARRPLNDCGFGLFCSGRGSVLFGSDVGSANGVLAEGATHAFESVNISQNNPLYIEEFQIGVDWLRHIECINGWAFARLGFEWQRWDSSETPFNFTQTLGGVHEFGRSISSDVTFTGLGFSVGFTH